MSKNNNLLGVYLITYLGPDEKGITYQVGIKRKYSYRLYLVGRVRADKVAKWVNSLDGKFSANYCGWHFEVTDSDFPCTSCGGTIGHRIDCPHGIAFSSKEIANRHCRRER